MNSLSCVPPEILSRILQSCSDFPELLALTSTCKHIHLFWVQNSRAIITETLVATLAVHSFSDALLAVRATNIIRKDFLSGVQIPRSFPFLELLCSSQKPSLDELKLVLDFRHLVRCAEHMFLHGVKEGLGQRYHPSEMAAVAIAEEFMDDDWVRFRSRFHRAMYRVLLSGAVLYGAYHEPFDRAKKAERGNEELPQFATGAYELDEYDMVQFFCHQIRNDGFQYIEQFAVYNLGIQEDGKLEKWKNESYDIIFGPLAKWIIEDGKARGVRRAKEEVQDDYDSQGEEDDVGEREVVESMFDPDTAGSIEEIMLLIGAFEHLTNKIRNLDGSRKYGRREFPIQEFVEARMSRNVAVIIYGVFAMEEICMPANVEESGEGFLIARPLQPQSDDPTQETEIPRYDQSMPHRVIDIPRVINRLQCACKKPNSRDGYPAPHPMYELFVFAARRFLGYIFQPIFFEQRADSGHVQQIEWGSVFVEAEHPFMEYAPLVGKS